MAELNLGGTSYAIAPFKLRELRRAAPYIDRLSARAGRLDSVEAVAETAADMLAVLAVGMGEVSLDALQDQASLADLDGLRSAFDQVMAEAGLRRPDAAPAGAAPSGEGEGTTAPVP